MGLSSSEERRRLQSLATKRRQDLRIAAARQDALMQEAAELRARLAAAPAGSLTPAAARSLLAELERWGTDHLPARVHAAMARLRVALEEA